MNNIVKDLIKKHMKCTECTEEEHEIRLFKATAVDRDDKDGTSEEISNVLYLICHHHWESSTNKITDDERNLIVNNLRNEVDDEKEKYDDGCA